jgi:poly(ADP-ribose) glycohydrolase ARH3
MVASDTRAAERGAGALVGTGVGDALGMPVEGWPPERIRENHGRVDEMLEGRLGAGTVTDDTHMALALGRSLLRRTWIVPEDVAEAFVEMYDPDRGYGDGTTRVLRLLREGIGVDEAAQRIFDGGSYGNGGAMRVAPVAVAYHRDVEALEEAVREATTVTHAHPLGVAGAVVQARAVARALRSEAPADVDPRAFVDAVEEGVPETLDVDGRFEGGLHEVRRLLDRDVAADPEEAADVLGNDSRAFRSVPAALYAALVHRDDLEEGLVYAVSLGGDTDTIGAMAGAILGAFHGRGAIPDRWWEALETGDDGRDGLVELGRDLAELRPAAMDTLG